MVTPTVGATRGTGRGEVRSEACVQEREAYAWLGADVASSFKEVEDKRMARAVPLNVSKRLRQKLEATEAARAIPRRSMQELELKEVALESGVLEQESATGTMDDP